MAWTPMDIVFVGLALSGALTTAAVTIIAAIKGNAAQAQAIAAQSQSTANRQAIDGLAARVQGHDQQLTTLAIHVAPPSGSTSSASASSHAVQPPSKGA